MASLLTAPQLRARAGGALRDARLSGSVEDAVFDQIVAEGTEALVAQSVSVARERFLSGGSLLVGSPVALPARPSGHSARLYVSELPPEYVPFCFALESPTGARAAYDDDPKRLERSPFSPFLYRVSGDRVEILSSETLTSVTAYLATVADVVRAVGEERVAEANAQMVKAAKEAVRARREEHAAQESPSGAQYPSPTPLPSPPADGPAA